MNADSDSEADFVHQPDKLIVCSFFLSSRDLLTVLFPVVSSHLHLLLVHNAVHPYKFHSCKKTVNFSCSLCHDVPRPCERTCQLLGCLPTYSSDPRSVVIGQALASPDQIFSHSHFPTLCSISKIPQNPCCGCSFQCNWSLWSTCKLHL